MKMRIEEISDKQTPVMSLVSTHFLRLREGGLSFYSVDKLVNTKRFEIIFWEG